MSIEQHLKDEIKANDFKLKQRDVVKQQAETGNCYIKDVNMCYFCPGSEKFNGGKTCEENGWAGSVYRFERDPIMQESAKKWREENLND